MGNQPYDSYAPRMHCLQLGEVRVHRSALGAMTNIAMPGDISKHLHATTSNAVEEVDKKEHIVVVEPTPIKSEDEMAVWGT